MARRFSLVVVVAVALGALVFVGRDGVVWVRESMFDPATSSSPEAGDELHVLTGTSYVPIYPYRAWDSRKNGGLLRGGDTEIIEMYVDFRGVTQIPSNAVAVSYNLTVTNTAGWGYIVLYPADSILPDISSVNWTSSGQTVANGGIVALGDWGGFVGAVEAYLGPDDRAVSTDYIIDITGYYI
ncbi:MAG: hypothetical protein ACKOCE_09800 [Acidimicrobiia bacterium]